MKKRSIALVVVMSVAIGEARESKIMSYIGNFVPSFTEIGMVTNVVNVYEKVSQFVRTTNRLVHSVERAKSDWERMTANVCEIYEDIRYLKKIDPYDMDSWQNGIDSYRFSLYYGKENAIDAFECLNDHTLGASERYVKSLRTIEDYDYTLERKRKQAQAIYLNSRYQSELAAAGEAIRRYRKNTIQQLRSLQAADAIIIQTSRDMTEVAAARERFDRLEQEIQSLEQSASQSVQRQKQDSIIDEAGNIIAVNLTEIKAAMERIEEMEKVSANLVTAFYRLTGGSMNSQSSVNEPRLPDIPLNTENFNASDPDKVPAPGKPSIPTEQENNGKKKISNHDILSLGNAAQLLGLKQDALKRDVLAMKVNTMAFIVSMEALKRRKTEQQTTYIAHQARMVDIVMEDLK
jgi:hypothetical protein